MSTFSLDGKTAVITGGSRGIGKAIALAFAGAGADVAVSNELFDDQLQTVAEEIKHLGRRSLAIKTDISSKDDIDSMVQKVVKEFGGIDILVNNAASSLVRVPVHEVKEADWDREINTNLKGYHLCCQAAAAAMIKQRRGAIINMASVSGMTTALKRGAYSISKAGVIMLTRMLAVELGSYNIRVNAIAPGVVMTERTRPLWGNDKIRGEIENSIPLHRFGKPEDIANLAVFVASEASSYITGQIIVIDGGVMAQPVSYDLIAFR